MTPEEIWRRKSDEEVIAARTCLSDYTDAGQQIILAEIDRRGLNVAAALDDPERIDHPLPGSPVDPDRSRKPVAGLKRRSVLLMIVFTLITIGFYYPCWFLMRRNAINSMNTDTKLGVVPLIVALVLLGTLVVLSVEAEILREAGESDRTRSVEAIGSVVELSTVFLMLAQCFKVRRIFESHLHNESANQTAEMIKEQRLQSAVDGMWVFLFQIYYLQHVINTRLIQETSIRAT